MEKKIYKNYPQKGQQGFQKSKTSFCYKCKTKKRIKVGSNQSYCRQCWNEYRREYYKKNPEVHKKFVVSWRKKNPEKVKVFSKRCVIKLKLETLSHYGELVCKCCGDKHWQFLTIDHIDNDGAKERKELGISGGSEFYYWLKKNNYPKKNYQILCLNCNRAKYDYGQCPHQNEKK